MSRFGGKPVSKFGGEPASRFGGQIVDQSLDELEARLNGIEEPQ